MSERDPDPGRALRNMSCPPRSTLVLRPFQLPAAPAARTGPADQGAPSNWGLCWFTRVDFDRILRASWPGWELERRPAAGPPPLRHLRLCGALALARVHDGIPAHPVHLEAMLDEDLGDELTRRAASLGRDLSLPALLLVTPAAGAARTADPDPVRALAILTHATGRTCNPGGAPLLSEALQAGHAIDLWTPEPAHA